ncbi:MAG: dienelactone hydrolase family protein [Pseudomonadota bacterium]
MTRTPLRRLGAVILLHLLVGACSGSGAPGADVVSSLDLAEADVVVPVDAGGEIILLRCPASVDPSHEPVRILESDRVFWDSLLSRIDPPGIPDDPDAFPAWQDETREALLHSLGFDGIEPPGTFVASELVDVLDRGDHLVELRLVEAHPGMWIPTLVLRPKGNATSLPGILVHHGHDQPGKSRDAILTLGVNLARRGALVVQPDWLFFGDLTRKENDHMHAEGNLLAGRSMNLPITSVARRMIDYLEQRPEVDPARLGMVGHSGGAETTLYLSAAEPRIHAAAPIDGVDDWTFRVGYRLFRDPEHFPTALLTFAGYREVVALSAPRWFFSLSGDEDYIAGPTHVVQEVIADAAIAWEHLGHPERILHQGFPGGHQVNRVKREAVYAFFASALDAPGLAGEEDGTAFTDDPSLHLAPPKGNRTILDVVRDLLDEALAALDAPSGDALSLILGSPGQGNGVLALEAADGAPIPGRAIRDEGPDLPVDLYLPEAWDGRRGVICIAREGRAACAAAGRLLSAIGWTVLAADLRGYGELYADWPAEDLWDWARTANLAVMLGDPLPNMQARDLSDLAVALRGHRDLDSVGVIGVGPEGGFLALLFGAAIPALDPVVALAPHLSLRSDFDDLGALYPAPCQIYPFGMFTAAAPEDLVGLLGSRDYYVTDHWVAEVSDQKALCNFFISLWK